jgi:hypothetical protein
LIFHLRARIHPPPLDLEKLIKGLSLPLPQTPRTAPLMMGIFDDVAKGFQRNTQDQVEGIGRVHLLTSIWAEVRQPSPTPPRLVPAPTAAAQPLPEPRVRKRMIVARVAPPSASKGALSIAVPVLAS